MNIRNILYALAKILGDTNAITGGTVLQRLQRRAMGRITGKTIMRKVGKK